MHKSEGMGTLDNGLAARPVLGSGVCAAAFTHFLLVSGQGGCSHVGGLAYVRVPGIGREEEVGAVYGVRSTWPALVLPLLCPL